MKKSNLKKFAALLIVGVMQLSVLTGCGGSSNDSNKSESTTATDEEITTVAESTSGDSTETDSSADTTADETAIEQVFNHIEVDGRHVDFPFTLNDLGDDYEFANYVDMGEFNEGTYGMDLMYKGEDIATVYVISQNVEDIDRNSEIIEIQTFDPHIGINGVYCNSSVETAEDKLSILTKSYDENNKLKDLKYSDNNYYVKVFVSDGMISAIYIDATKSYI